MPRDLPEDVVRFIAEFVDSAGVLETLLLLRAAPEKPWTAPEVARALVSTEAAAATNLRDLAAKRLVTISDGGYAYGPGSQAARIDALAECYAKRRHTVIGVIYGADSGAAATLSDAFRLRRRRSDG